MNSFTLPAVLPVLSLRDAVVFPGTVVPLLLGRESSIQAVELAMEHHQGHVLLCLQKDPIHENPTPSELFKHGVLAKITSQVRIPGGMTKINAEGLEIALAKDWAAVDGAPLRASVHPRRFRMGSKALVSATREALLDQWSLYAPLRSDIPDDLLDTFKSVQDPLKLLWSIAPFLPADPRAQQALIEASDFAQLSQMITGLIEGHLVSLKRNQRLEHEVRMRVQRNQRDFLLREQIRLLQEELDSTSEPSHPEIAALRKKMEGRLFPTEVEQRLHEEIQRLASSAPGSPEFGVGRNYIDTLINIPFGSYAETTKGLSKAKKALNANHYGLDKVKERILEHVAVLQRPRQDQRSAVLCLSGPPGVGKTSLASAIAEALGRPFARIALGGVRDEAEIRGHRRTYVGALPGKITQALRKCEVMNPVILLDEIDKMSHDHRGDPGSALLEVLDPEQNHAFADHYLELGLDLSQVLFIATANVEHAIPEVLRDRLEVLRLSGYHQHEKQSIAVKHLIPRARRRTGLEIEEWDLETATVARLTKEYTREAGVRHLDRQLDSLARKRVLELAQRKKCEPIVAPTQLETYLGPAPYRQTRLDQIEKPGIITGLAWTSSGGDMLKIEVSLLSGKGRLKLTGALGEVMKESAHLALTLTREKARRYGIDPEIFNKTDVHIHVPEGAVPKDGPSAGITLCLALLSAFTRRAISPKWCFTGEISLTGKVHAIGGLPEKTLAALEAGAEVAFFPADNAREIPELPAPIRKGLQLRPVADLDELLALTLPAPKRKKGEAEPA